MSNLSHVVRNRLIACGMLMSVIAIIGSALTSGNSRSLLASPETSATIPPLPRSLAVTGQAVIGRENGLWLSDATGTFHVVAMAPPGGQIQDPVWRADGVAVAFTQVVPRPTPDAEQSVTDGSNLSEIWQVTRTGSVQKLAAPDAEGVGFSQPYWSPDGRSIYYVRDAYSEKGGIASHTQTIERRDIETGTRARVIDNGFWPTLDPTGKRLAWVRFEGSRADLWVRDIATGDEHRVTDGRFANITGPRFSPDGRAIGFGGASSIVSRQAFGASAQQALPSPLLRLLLAPVAEAHELPANLWLVGDDGSNLRQIGHDVLDGPLVRWTADPVRVFVYDEFGLFQYNLSDGRSTIILSPGSYHGFDWLPATQASR